MNNDEQEFRQMHIAELIETIANLGVGDDWDGSFTDAGEVRFLLAERICKERVASLESKWELIVRNLEGWEALVNDSRLPEDVTAKAVCKSIRELVEKQS